MFGKKKLQVKVYDGEKEFEKGHIKERNNGWTVQNVVSNEAGRSKKSWVMLGLFNFGRKKRIRYTVTFVRA